MTSADKHELHRYEYMRALGEYNLPYYALAYMLYGACRTMTKSAFSDEDFMVAGIRYNYLWHVADGIASRLRTPMSDELITGEGLVDKIVPGLVRVSLPSLGVPALASITVKYSDHTPEELSGHALTVNLSMADAHAELYDTGYDPDLLPAVSLGRGTVY